MSARQDKYIANLLKHHHNDVLAAYRASREAEMAAGWSRPYDMALARRALQAARDTVLRDIAIDRNLLHIEADVDDYMTIDDYGDFENERERKRVAARIDADRLAPYVFVAYVRNAAGEWDIVDSVGGVWVDSATVDENFAHGRAMLDIEGDVRAALYRHRDAKFGEFEKVYVPGHWAVK